MVFLSGDLTVVLRARYHTGMLRAQETGAIRGLRVIRVNLRTFGDLTVVLRARYPTGRLRTLETGANRAVPF